MFLTFIKLNHFLPRTEDLNPNWRNPPSIHYYTLPEFEDLIYGLKDKNANAYQIFKEFREGTNLRSNELDFTIEELQQDQKKISELYQKLFDLMPTIPTLETPFEIRKRNRHKEAIRKRVKQLGYIVSDIKYKYVYASTTLEDYPEVRFPFIFEIAILNIAIGVYKLLVVNGINSSSRVGDPFMTRYIDGYSWLPVGADNYKYATTLEDILEEYGYSRDPKKSRKPHSMVIANLISPRIQYRSYGKSQIDLDPFVNVIAETTYKICTLGKKPSDTTNKDSNIRNATDALTKILSDRLDAITKNPETKITDPWTQSTVFYYTRKLMKDKGIEDRSRKHITNSIRIVCERLKTTREELGITAADRAQLYFKGQMA